jgi:hypothetical protein
MFQIPNTNFWIIKGEWITNQANKGYHHCPSFNTGGELNISINDEVSIHQIGNQSVHSAHLDSEIFGVVTYRIGKLP